MPDLPSSAPLEKHPPSWTHFLSCREMSQLASLELDTTLPWPQRLALRVHRVLCGHCRRYGAQLRLLRQALRKLTERLPEDAQHPALSPDARARIKDVLKQS